MGVLNLRAHAIAKTELPGSEFELQAGGEVGRGCLLANEDGARLRSVAYGWWASLRLLTVDACREEVAHADQLLPYLDSIPKIELILYCRRSIWGIQFRH